MEESGEESELLGDFRDSTHRKMGNCENRKSKEQKVQTKQQTTTTPNLPYFGNNSEVNIIIKECSSTNN